MDDVERVEAALLKRMKAVEAARKPQRRCHIVWWGEDESESDIRRKIERMIALGTAHEDDQFFFPCWDQ